MQGVVLIDKSWGGGPFVRKPVARLPVTRGAGVHDPMDNWFDRVYCSQLKDHRRTRQQEIGMKFTPKAKKIWESVPSEQRLRILNQVWCVQCMKSSSMGNVSAKVEKGRLSLSGICTRCGGVVAKIVEPV